MRRPGLVAVLASMSLATAAQAAPDGADLYAQQCAVCHQADAGGAPGEYPPLKNRVDKIASTKDGVHYLADLLTHGMSGSIQAGGDSYVGYMPSFKALKDEEIAAILSWISAQGSTKPPPVITAADIAAARGDVLTASAVNKERQALDAQHPLP